LAAVEAAIEVRSCS